MRSRKRPCSANVAASTAPLSAGSAIRGRPRSAGRRRAPAGLPATPSHRHAALRSRGCASRRPYGPPPRRVSRAPGRAGRRGGVQLDPDAAPLRHLVRVAEQAEAGHVGDRVRLEGPQHVGRLAAEDRHRRASPPRAPPRAAALRAPREGASPSRAASSGRARRRAARRSSASSPSGCTVPTTASPYFGSSSRSVCRRRGSRRPRAPARRAAPKIAASVSFGRLSGKAAIESASSGDAAHREDVVERVRRGDAPEERWIVDERREEVEREDERALVVELVDDGIVRGREPDEQVLGLGGHEPSQQLVEAGGGVLGSAAAARREGGEALRHACKIRLGNTTAAGEPPLRSQGRGGALMIRAPGSPS